MLNDTFSVYCMFNKITLEQAIWFDFCYQAKHNFNSTAQHHCYCMFSPNTVGKATKKLKINAKVSDEILN